MQHHAIDLALENAGLDQAEERLEQHFADAVQTLLERRRLYLRKLILRADKPLHDSIDQRGVAVTNDEALRQRVADSDADLARAPPSRTRPAACSPIAYFWVSPIGSDGGANSGKFSLGLSSTAKNSSAQVARARHERQLELTCPDELE